MKIVRKEFGFCLNSVGCYYLGIKAFFGVGLFCRVFLLLFLLSFLLFFEGVI